MNAPFKLKHKPKRDDYQRGVCAASRCSESSVVVDASRKRWPDDVPLCDRHWSALCDFDDTVDPESTR